MSQSRTHNCGELRGEDVGKNVRIAGWLQNMREMGGNLAFLVVRDFYGVTQVVAEDAEILEQAREIQRESTIMVEGTVRLRSSVNKELPTGMIEIVPEKITVLGRCSEALPFEISNSHTVREDMRMKYRFLDLRNPIVRDKMVMRSLIVSELRRSMTDRGFLEITTPILTCSSPEGARDYIVPSRVHPGMFYALPQAPQQFKQILMASGFDRYFQIAPCFRDEDARADRSPGEFYQLDIEMAFATQEDVFSTLEDVLPPIFEKFSSWPCSQAPFKRIAYADAMELYGTDKPDLRIPLTIADVTAELDGCGFEAFDNKCVKAIVIQDFNQTRKFIDNLAVTIEADTGCKMFWFKVDESGNYAGGVSKFLADRRDSLDAKLSLKKGAFVAMVAGDRHAAQKAAGMLRVQLGTALNLIDREKFDFCWIVDFPMYEIGEESGKLEFSHNPFSMPQGGMEALTYKEPLDILAYQYDIVCNGVELSSGAVRNHDPEIMVKAFDIVGIPADMVREKFPAMYGAFTYGAPPHAGIAPGVDRMIMLICDEPNIREIIPFPMNKNAQDLMMGAPSPVEQSQLDEVHIMLNLPKDEEK